MEVTLKDGRKATLLSENSSFAIIRLADGREMPYPKEKVIYPSPPEPELKKVVIPAIERLEELRHDMMALKLVGAPIDSDTQQRYDKLFGELSIEACKELIDKWGLTS